MANNHGLDYGPDGLAETLAVKRAQADGFIIGIGGDEAEAFAPFTTEVKGQRISVIGATQVLDSSLIGAWTATATHGGLASAKRVDRLVEEVAAARGRPATPWWCSSTGASRRTPAPPATSRRWPRRLVDAGADIVVGGHAHRLQGGGRLGDAVVHYGLGNFLFKENSAEGARTGVFTVTVTGRRIDGYEWIPGPHLRQRPPPARGRRGRARPRSHWKASEAAPASRPDRPF